MAHSQAYINITIGNIQVLHARFANEYCNFLKRRTGREVSISRLTSINNIIGKVLYILDNYVPYGNTTLNDLYNGLTEEEITALIEYSYRVMNKYTYNVFVPDDPNVYL